MIWQQAMMVGLQAGVPTLLWGKPGTGKTSVAYQLAQKWGLPLEVVIASLREPSDFLGLPIVHDGGQVSMAPPAWAKRLAAAGKGLLVLDELTTAAPAVQSALLRVVLERVVGDLELPSEVRVLAIANTAKDAGGWDLSLPLSNRFMHVQATPLPANEWADGLLGGWNGHNLAHSEVDVNRGAVANSMVAGFVKVRGELLLRLPNEGDANVEAWPSPRSWHMAARVLTHAKCLGVDPDVELTCVAGCVGPGVALEFKAWAEQLDLPDPMELLRNPGKFKVPKKGDVCFVILGSVVDTALPYVMDKDVKVATVMWEAAWALITKVCDANYIDIAYPSAKKLALKGGERKELARPVAALRKLNLVM